ncbi:MAG: dihydroorotate dehydrogenase electron transfer subunit [Candidatus Omnitrophica bacterium]|nr:dihydroorotate dehydrogenase electron transfer subunit [Candidatus Omnitrophota bacterium]
MRIRQNRAEILTNAKICGKYHKLIIKDAKISRNSRPGQFLMLKVGDSQGPLLRRPLSIHRVDKEKIEMLYERIGPGTEILAQRKAGEFLDVIGPLGNGFTLPPESRESEAVLLAGGMGVAPLVFWAQRLVAGKRKSAGDRIQVFIGARTKEQILCEKEFKKLGCDVKIATDDGSAGFFGRVTGLLEAALQTMDCQRIIVYACGPQPMLRELVRICRKKLISSQVSLEEHMACGIGACLGCVVNTIDGYKRVCKEGPVFEAKKLIY